MLLLFWLILFMTTVIFIYLNIAINKAAIVDTALMIVYVIVILNCLSDPYFAAAFLALLGSTYMTSFFCK